MGVLARVRKVSTRWDVPNARWWQRHSLGSLVFVWLVVASVVSYALITGWAGRVVFILLGAAIGSTFGTWLRARARRPQPLP